jgi:hypothetical protein
MSKSEYKHNWYILNKKRLNIKAKLRYKHNKKEIIAKGVIYTRQLRERKPWLVSLNKARARCNNPKQKDYKNYGEKGIKCLITKEEIQELWFRDKAYNLKRPSIDRKDSNKDYTFENCRFIELSLNSALTNRVKK